jgi:two-component system, NtrC family, sensor kinase
LVNAEGVGVLLLNEFAEELYFAAVSGPGSQGLQGYTLPMYQGIAGYVMRSGQPFTMTQRQEARGIIHAGAESQSKFKAESLLAVPITLGVQTLGVLEAVHSQPQHFAPDALPLLQGAAAWAAIALRNAHLYQQVNVQYEQLQQSQAQLVQAEKLSALGRLMASIAHEVNNPIQGMQGCLTLATEELALVVPDALARAEVDFYLDVVQKELVRVAVLVERMRNFYQPAQSGQYPTAVGDILSNVISLSQKQLDQTDVSLHTHIDSTLPLVMANPDHLKQVFLNLLLNALEAMPEGGDLYLTACRASKKEAVLVGQNTAVLISFRDTGIGIDPNDYPHLFEPFFSTKAKGSGLGLPTSYNIIQAYNGHIAVSNPPNGGTTVTVLLPTA